MKSNKREYHTWVAMKQRCYNTNHPKYHRYGGRGIKVCARWIDSFDNFIEDMGPSPSKKHTLDRENNDGNYTPINCRWATVREQQNNMSSNVKLSYSGEVLSISEWSRRLSTGRTTIISRLRRGWTPEEALSTTIGPYVRK